MAQSPRPVAVSRALREVGESIATWRRLRDLTVLEVSDRAGVGLSTLQRLERGQGGTMESFLRVARALGVMDEVVRAVDPMSTDVGRLRAVDALPSRVRRKGKR